MNNRSWLGFVASTEYYSYGFKYKNKVKFFPSWMTLSDKRMMRLRLWRLRFDGTEVPEKLKAVVLALLWVELGGNEFASSHCSCKREGVVAGGC